MRFALGSSQFKKMERGLVAISRQVLRTLRISRGRVRSFAGEGVARTFRYLEKGPCLSPGFAMPIPARFPPFPRKTPNHVRVRLDLESLIKRNYRDLLFARRMISFRLG